MFLQKTLIINDGINILLSNVLYLMGNPELCRRVGYKKKKAQSKLWTFGFWDEIRFYYQ